MKPIAALAALAAVFAADGAAAAGGQAIHHRSPSHATAARPHKASLTHHRRRSRQHLVTAASRTEGKPAEQVYRANDADQGAPSHPGFFRSEQDKEAGWGFRQGGMHAVVGAYQRPERPDIPNPQTVEHEGRGAAGLSLSFKLGQ